ncbi:conserved hypothetical protein [uncultured Paludibacter sp.]|nr:conserved hypothetical protein [uncultured Paludibacter sp.]
MLSTKKYCNFAIINQYYIIMKKIILLSLSAVLISIEFTSCIKKEEMQMREINYSNKFYLSPDTSIGALSVSINVELPDKYHDKEVMENIQKQIIAKIFNEQYTHIPVDSIVPVYVRKLYQSYLQDYTPDFQEAVKKTGGPKMNNEIDIEGVSMFLDNKILSYSYESFVYLGGAHGNTNRMLYNFDLRNAYIIKESDLFISDYKETLTELIKEQIVEQSAEIESVADLNDFDFWADQIKPNENFYISEDGLVYVFNPYEIAPYSMGQTEVTLPYEKLKPLLKPGNIIEYLYKNTPVK